MEKTTDKKPRGRPKLAEIDKVKRIRYELRMPAEIHAIVVKNGGAPWVFEVLAAADMERKK